MSKLTEDEMEIMKMIKRVGKKYCELPVQHRNDPPKFMENIHKLQQLLMIRPTIRSHEEFGENPEKVGDEQLEDHEREEESG